MVPPQRQDRRRGICRKGPHSLWFPHLAQIQVCLQVIGVIELQDPPEWSPFPALPGEEGQWVSKMREGMARGLVSP